MSSPDITISPLLHLEALIFASENGVTLDDLRQVLQTVLERSFSPEELHSYLDKIREKYGPDHAVALVEINGGYQFLTRKEYHAIINQLQIQRSKKKLSQAAMETLAIIAYRQPITKLEIEQIRGVNCDYTIQRLLEKELITITGKSEAIGKPLLYSTSSLFMDYFGLNDKSELPKLSDIAEDVNEIGDQNE